MGHPVSNMTFCFKSTKIYIFDNRLDEYLTEANTWFIGALDPAPQWQCDCDVSTQQPGTGASPATSDNTASGCLRHGREGDTVLRFK